MTSLDMKLQNFKHPINTWRQYYGCRQTEKPYISNRQNAYEILELYQHYILNDGTIMNTGGSPYLSVKYIIAAINLYLFDIKDEDNLEVVYMKVDHHYVQNSIFTQIWYSLNDRLMKVPSLSEICRFTIRKSAASSLNLLREDNNTYSPVFFPLIKYGYEFAHYRNDLVQKIKKIVVGLPKTLQDYVKLPHLDIITVSNEIPKVNVFGKDYQQQSKHVYVVPKNKKKNKKKELYYPPCTVPSWFVEI